MELIMILHMAILFDTDLVKVIILVKGNFYRLMPPMLYFDKTSILILITRIYNVKNRRIISMTFSDIFIKIKLTRNCSRNTPLWSRSLLVGHLVHCFSGVTLISSARLLYNNKILVKENFHRLMPNNIVQEPHGNVFYTKMVETTQQ